MRFIQMSSSQQTATIFPGLPFISRDLVLQRNILTCSNSKSKSQACAQSAIQTGVHLKISHIGKNHELRMTNKIWHRIKSYLPVCKKVAR